MAFGLIYQIEWDQAGAMKWQFTTWSRTMYPSSEVVSVRSETADTLVEMGSDGWWFNSIPLRSSKIASEKGVSTC
jgi:hypothetical protein